MKAISKEGPTSPSIESIVKQQCFNIIDSIFMTFLPMVTSFGQPNSGQPSGQIFSRLSFAVSCFIVGCIVLQPLYQMFVSSRIFVGPTPSRLKNKITIRPAAMRFSVLDLGQWGLKKSCQKRTAAIQMILQVLSIMITSSAKKNKSLACDVILP